MKKHNMNFFGKNYEVSTTFLVILLMLMFAFYTVSCLGMYSVSWWIIPVWFILSFEFPITKEDGTVKDYSVIKNNFTRSFISGAFLSLGMFMFFHQYINV